MAFFYIIHENTCIWAQLDVTFFFCEILLSYILNSLVSVDLCLTSCIIKRNKFWITIILQVTSHISLVAFVIVHTVVSRIVHPSIDPRLISFLTILKKKRATLFDLKHPDRFVQCIIILKPKPGINSFRVIIMEGRRRKMSAKVTRILYGRESRQCPAALPTRASMTNSPSQAFVGITLSPVNC